MSGSKKSGELPDCPALENLNFRTVCAGRLPAAVAASAPIAPITVPASAPASTAAPTASSSTPATTTEAATAASPASAPSAFPRRPGLVHNNVAAHEIVAVQSLNGALGFVIAIDFDKSEPARLTRKTVAHQGDIRRGDSRLSK